MIAPSAKLSCGHESAKQNTASRAARRDHAMPAGQPARHPPPWNRSRRRPAHGQHTCRRKRRPVTTRTAPPPQFRGNPTPPRPINCLALSCKNGLRNSLWHSRTGLSNSKVASMGGMDNDTSARRRLTPKGERTRARIVEEAAALIHERGVAGTFLEDVKAAAGVSGSQLYNYFPDKDE